MSYTVSRGKRERTPCHNIYQTNFKPQICMLSSQSIKPSCPQTRQKCSRMIRVISQLNPNRTRPLFIASWRVKNGTTSLHHSFSLKCTWQPVLKVHFPLGYKIAHPASDRSSDTNWIAFYAVQFAALPLATPVHQPARFISGLPFSILGEFNPHALSSFRIALSSFRLALSLFCLALSSFRLPLSLFLPDPFDNSIWYSSLHFWTFSKDGHKTSSDFAIHDITRGHAPPKTQELQPIPSHAQWSFHEWAKSVRFYSNIHILLTYHKI